jgi:hypothetical protein
VDLAVLAAVPSIRQPIDESLLVTLNGNVHPLVTAGYDRGVADPNLPADRMLLVLKRNPQQDADLAQLLTELHDNNSANFHKWLSPAQYGERFGAAPEDVQVLTGWLEGHGFKVNRVNAARTEIEFSGTIGQLEQTFHTTVRRYVVNGQQHLANASDPKIPAAIAPVVAGLSGMNDFFPTALRTTPVRATYDKAMHLASPEFTTAGGGNALYVGPNDAATIYDTPNQLNANFKGAQSYTGAGITIGVISDANINTADVDNYRSFFGLPANTPQVIIDGENDPGVDTSTTGHTQQALMELEIAGALAPNAHVILYTAKNTTLSSGLSLALSRALNDDLADILIFGFSTCEAAMGASGNAAIQSVWQQYAVEGTTVVVAAGDAGPAGCDNPRTETAAKYGFGVNGYASTVYNIAVGGTDFDGLTANFNQYVGSNGTASGYIPESPWNNSVALGQNGAVSGNTPNKNAAGATDIDAGGGGASSCVNGAAHGKTCIPPANGSNTGWPKPSWQQDNGSLNIPNDGVRDLPDVSMLAGNGQYGASWAVCGNDYDASGNSIADCAPGSGSAAHIQGIGGTSASAAAFAGILALVAQSQTGQQGIRLGQANYVLYNLATKTNLYNTVFHDIQSGNNSVVCTGGSADCGSNGFLTGYNAKAAFDQASGLGSVDATALIGSWTAGLLLPSTTSLAIVDNGVPVSGSVPYGTPLKFTITVTGAKSTPTGIVGIVADPDETSGGALYGYDWNFIGNLTNGVSISMANDAPGGTYNAWARYSGDAIYAASQSSPVQLSVTPENSTLNLYLYQYVQGKVTAVNGVTVPYGTYLGVDAQPVGVTPNAGYATGTVTFQDNLVTIPTPADNINNTGFAELPEYYWPGGSHSVTASYSGDKNFNPAKSTAPLTFTVTQVPTGLTLSAAPTSLISGTTTLTGTVAPSSTNPGSSPSGTVMLTDSTNGTSLGTATLVASRSAVTGGAIATFNLTVDASSLAVGANSLTATYAGDTNYSGANGAASVTRLPQIATAVAVTASPASLISGTTVISGQIAAANGNAGTAPTGKITLTDSTNSVTLGTATLVAGPGTGGVLATFTLTINASSLAAGANTLTATYAGDTNYAGGAGTASVIRLPQVATTVALNASPTSLASGTAVINGQVTPANGSAGSAPTGAITLIDSTNGVTLGTTTLVVGSSTGEASATFTLTVNASTLATGANVLTATYAGDINYAGASGTTTVTITPLPPPAISDFAISATSVMIASPGQTTGNISTITVTPVNGFTGPVALTTELASGPASALSPPTIQLSSSSVMISGGSPASVTATIATTALTYGKRQSAAAGSTPARWYSAGGAALACVLLFGIPARRRAWKTLLALLLFAAVGMSIGCGVSLNPILTNATTSGTYIFNVTATDQGTGKLSATGTITVTVK